ILPCATTPHPARPSAPVDLRVSRLSSTNVLLRWEPSEEPGVLYRVYSDGMKVEGMTRGTTFNPSGRVGARANCYRVAAVDASGRESPPTTEECAAPGGELTSAR
ncbi:MAG TPA: fibronectin type III domain-containing protein, partial [Anaeromyxobacteraceae bacterium]|nr:fibronectin type III domain-containing protein [Anaeromyxobacteraceae bacterium]